jgi:hypothetical protein
VKPEENKLANVVTAGIEKHWSAYNARPYALAAIVSIREAGYAIVPMEPTEPMWSELARDIVMWDRFPRHTGADLHAHLRSLGRTIPDWLAKEIPDTDQVPPKGTVAACIYKAMIEAANANHL